MLFAALPGLAAADAPDEAEGPAPAEEPPQPEGRVSAEEPSFEGERAARAENRRRPRRLAWPEQARQAGWGEVITAGVLGGGVVAAQWFGSTETPLWTRVNRVDAALRDGLAVSGDALERVRIASDVLMLTAAAYPVLIEDLGLVLIGDRNPELLAEVIAIDAQAYAITGLLVGVVKVTASRERPYAYAAGCALDKTTAECVDEDRNRSFYSGHSAIAFTGAGLTCFHQQQLPNLYGSRAAGAGVCASAMALATSTAVLRVLGDMHWTTDVITGAALGLASGWLFPWLLHGRTLLAIEGENASGALWPIVDRGTYGVEVRGSFTPD